MKLFITLLLFSITLSSYAFEKSNAFIITIFDMSIKVVTPTQKTPKVAIIIENRTLSDIRGKIEADDGTILQNMNLLSGKSKSMEFSTEKCSHFVFVPLSPAFQEVVLNFKDGPHEIPHSITNK